MSYFAAPQETLDPSLFDGKKLRLEVKSYLMARPVEALQEMGLRAPVTWLYIFLAGSGVTYQWTGNTDLDVFLGVDWVKFRHVNEGFAHMSEADVAEGVNNTMRRDVWPQTSAVQFGEQVYQVTFYWVHDVASDISKIHPYAAYDVHRGQWVVDPPELPVNPGSLYSADWFTAAQRDTDVATDLAQRYSGFRTEFDSNLGTSPLRHTAGAQLHLIAAQARTLFEDIHHGRTEAFGEQGTGYGDWHNFRWQSAKSSGTIDALQQIIRLTHADESLHDQDLYGGEISGAHDALRRAELWKSGRLG